jgi:hypothetical protein
MGVHRSVIPGDRGAQGMWWPHARSGSLRDRGRQDEGMEPDVGPNLDEFLLARIAEDKRFAGTAAEASGGEEWSADELSPGLPEVRAAQHAARFDPARVLAECSAKRRIVLACRESGPAVGFLGARPPGMADWPLSPHDQHQLAALVLAVLALPYADHPEYRQEWRP